MNSGRSVQQLRKLINHIVGVFKDDPDKNEFDNHEQPQAISQIKMQNRREYIALGDDSLQKTDYGRGRWP